MNRTLRPLFLALSAILLILTFAACKADNTAPDFRTPNNVRVYIGADADATVAALGTPLSKNESPSCGGIPGHDCVYTYAGFRIKTTPAKGGDVVCQIEFTDDSVKTSSGVYIGMKVEDAKAAMGMTPETVGENLVYKAAGMKLQIICHDGYVTGILFVSA